MAESENETPVGSQRRGAWKLWGRIAIGLLVLVAIIVVAFRFHSVRQEVDTAAHHITVAGLPWLLPAVGAEALSFYCYALVQRRLLGAGGAKLSRRTMVTLAVGATGVTNLVPGGTAPASGWLVGQYRRRGVPMPLALWAVLVGGAAATVSVLFLLLLGAVIADLVSVPLFFVLLAVLVVGSVALVRAVGHLDTLDRWIQRRGSAHGARLLKKVSEQVATLARFKTSPLAGAHVLGLSLANWAMDVICLMASFAVLGLSVPWRALLFAYATAQVAGSLAPVPGGIGFVEGGMIGAFALAGAPAGPALLAIGVYRLITCWAIAAIGGIVLVRLSGASPKEHAQMSKRARGRATSH